MTSYSGWTSFFQCVVFTSLVSYSVIVMTYEWPGGEFFWDVTGEGVGLWLSVSNYVPLTPGPHEVTYTLLFSKIICTIHVITLKFHKNLKCMLGSTCIVLCTGICSYLKDIVHGEQFFLRTLFTDQMIW